MPHWVVPLLRSWFDWPDGGVWSNLAASAIWAAPAGIHLHRKITRNHREIRREHRALRRHLGVPDTDDDA